MLLLSLSENVFSVPNVYRKCHDRSLKRGEVMNKKANLSLVILSVVAIAALGGIAIMYNGGATGAATIDGPILEEKLVVEDFNKIKMDLDLSFLDKYDIDADSVNIDDVSYLLNYKFSGPISPPASVDEKVKFSWDALGDDYESSPILRSSLDSITLDSSKNKAKLVFQGRAEGLAELLGDVLLQCTACEGKIEGDTLKVTISEPIQKFEFRIIPGSPPTIWPSIYDGFQFLPPVMLGIQNGDTVSINVLSGLDRIICPGDSIDQVVGFGDTVSFMPSASGQCIAQNSGAVLVYQVV